MHTKMRSARDNVPTYGSTRLWIEQYRGGWQLLYPSLGISYGVHCTQIGFDVMRWATDEVYTGWVDLDVEVLSVPVVINGMLALGATVALRDPLSNLSDVSLEFDYPRHPALGRASLQDARRINTGATRFTTDPDSTSWLEPGRAQEWPWFNDCSGERVDLRELPGSGETRSLFCCFHTLSEYWASMKNGDLGLVARIEWDGAKLPYRRAWQEFNPNGRVDVVMSLTLERGRA